MKMLDTRLIEEHFCDLTTRYLEVELGGLKKSQL